MSKTAEMKIYLKIDDEAEFIETARMHAVAVDGMDRSTAESMIVDVSSAAVMLFDPGSSPAGCTILESEAEVTRWP